MNRSMHLIGCFVFWLIALIGYFYSKNDFPGWSDSLWIISSFLMAIVGAELPDFDLEIKKFFPHRSAFTHSILFPGLLSLPLIFHRNIESVQVLVPVYSMFLVGVASHLILDLSPKTWKGSALIHLPWRNMQGKKALSGFGSVLWLFVNAFLLTTSAVIMLFFYMTWTS